MRRQDLTSSDIGPLFSVSTYKTYFRLWHEKAGNLPDDFVGGERVEWGQILEDAIARGCAKMYDWKVRRRNVYMRFEELKLGSSFDYDVTEPEKAILEVKNVDWLQFKDKWVEGPNGLEGPPHIELQLQHQMMIRQADIGYCCVLVGGNDIKVLRRDRDEGIIARIIEQAAAFWASIDAGIPPAKDYVADADSIIALCPHTMPGTSVDLSGDAEFIDLCTTYADSGKVEKQAKNNKAGAKARIIEILNGNERGYSDDFGASKKKSFRLSDKRK